MTTTAASRRQLHADDTRRALLASARRRFGEHGYAGTSLDDVARDAGVTIGAAYHHFGGKAQLFDAVFVDVEAELLERSRRAVARRRTASVVDRLLVSFEAYLTAVEDDAVRRIIYADAPAVLGAARYDEVFEQYGRSGLRAGLAQAAADGAEIVGGVDTASRVVFGALVAAAAQPARGRRARRDALAALDALLRAVIVT